MFKYPLMVVVGWCFVLVNEGNRLIEHVSPQWYWIQEKIMVKGYEVYSLLSLLFTNIFIRLHQLA